MSYLPPNQFTADQFAGLLAFVGREPGNLVWAVRSGTDGIGLDLFHVYAPDMDTARERAAENLSQISEAHKLYAERGLFTVHAGVESDVTLKSGPYREIPAIDVPDFDFSKAV